MNQQLDNFDRHILRLLQQSNRITSEVIAEQVGLSAAAVQRRIKRLRQQKVIQADISVVTPKSVGQDVTLIVQVSLERERADLIKKFKTSMLQHPNVQQCYYVTGSNDFILIITAADMAHYEAFTQAVFFDDDNVQTFKTHVVMDATKVGLSIPIPDLDST